MDKIIIRDLEVFANHGVFQEENVLGQKFLVSVEAQTDTRPAGKTDNLSDSINYADICVLIEKQMKKRTCKLIEAAAEELAEDILLAYPKIQSVCLTLKKPWAPILMPVDHVAVEITRSWHTAYIGLGSNMGDKKAYLKKAITALDTHRCCHVEKVSSFLVTEPVGDVVQDDFLNGALKLRTLLTPRELLELCHKIEADAGRKREIHWGPRTLDLDILFYDDLILDSADLTIPHPEIMNRDFVKIPMREIAPHLCHPLFRTYL